MEVFLFSFLEKKPHHWLKTGQSYQQEKLTILGAVRLAMLRTGVHAKKSTRTSGFPWQHQEAGKQDAPARIPREGQAPRGSSSFRIICFLQLYHHTSL